MNEFSPPTTGRTWRPATQLVRGGMARSGFDETSEALYLTSGFVYPDAASAEAAFANKLQRFVYSRFANPTVANFEERLRLIEGAEACRATSSGMAAVYAAIVACVKAGDHIVAARALFGSCQYILGELLPRFGVRTTFVDGEDLDQWRTALAPGAACVFFESPSNPGLSLVDVQAVCELAHQAGATVVVDNVFASPLLQKPLELGADVVVYSATKHIDGQGRCLGGAILGSKAFVEEKLQPFLRHTGPALSPFNAWVLLKGLETLPLRMERHVASAERVARHFEGHAKLDAVRYPFLDSHPQAALARRQMKAGGTIVCFDVAGGKEGAFRFLDALSLVDISNNLGDAKSLVTHPSTTTHQRLSPEDRARQGIGPGLVRLSVGLEDVDDIIEDVEAALAAV
ncbi:O-succinylhomoserine sulfhydrylase [Stella humosa]|uniref:O-succinylhomoserine sulfhydrylase n=1 Tax=Stella humosa TaxID=94 RepID=A0A3N1MB47_9PROT|nr:O-succinylhomoserine sulfhydrylase [Stella humosa]ROP99989.1 O-succinylhomoserine sulfhydrylase [Stella humosa]BBK30780.1 O-succinylhomoserine sulfhydrylase [Stella humosa]